MNEYKMHAGNGEWMEMRTEGESEFGGTHYNVKRPVMGGEAVGIHQCRDHYVYVLRLVLSRGVAGPVGGGRKRGDRARGLGGVWGRGQRGIIGSRGMLHSRRTKEVQSIGTMARLATSMNAVARARRKSQLKLKSRIVDGS